MALVLKTAPASEPVSLAEAKAHLRVDSDHEDALIGQLIAAARLYVERALGLALITQGWSYFLDAWPRSSCVALPISPVQSVASVTLHEASGGAVEVMPESYAVDVLSKPARLLFKAAPQLLPRELNAFEIAFTAGYGDEAEDAPQPIRQAILLLVAHWFERREPVVLGLSAQEVPATVAGLLAPYRKMRL